jgi:hypothetical protein
MKTKSLLILLFGLTLAPPAMRAQVTYPEPCKAAFIVALDSATGYPFLYHFKDNSNGNINSWLWDFGDGTTSSEQNPLHQYASEGNYQICLTVSNTNSPDSCYDQTCHGILTEQYYSLGGLVYAGDVPLNNPMPQGDTGVASLYRVSDNLVTFVEENIFSDYGYYWFGYVLPGKYMVKVGLTEHSTHYSQYFTTYSGEKVNWSQAAIFSLENASNYEAEVSLVPVKGLGNGTGIIRGYVNFEQGGEYHLPPITQTTVILADKDKVPLVCTHPDAAGYFIFNDVPFDTYFLSADATGKPSTVVTVTLTQDAPVADGINLTIFGGNIFGIPEDLASGFSVMKICPNPVSDMINLQVFASVNNCIELRISDVTGKIQYSEVQTLRKGLNSFHIPAGALPSGIYMLNICSQDHGQPVTLKFVK